MDPTQNPSVNPQSAMMLQLLSGQNQQPGMSNPAMLQQAALQAQMAAQPPSQTGLGSQSMASPMVAPDPASMTGGLGSSQGMPAPTPPQGMQGLNGMDPTTAALFSQIPSATGGQ